MADRHDANDEQKGSPIGRRSYLKLTTAGLAAVGLPAAATRVSAATVDLGAQGLSEGDLIDPYLEDHFTSGNEVVVPDGTYRWEGSGLDGDYSNATLRAENEAVFQHDDGMSRGINIVVQSGDVLFQNITIDGACEGDNDRIRAEVHDPNGSIEFNNFNLPDGNIDGQNDAQGFYVPREHAGEARFIDCHVEGFGNNGLYASSPGYLYDEEGQNGRVVVDGGLYKNNNISNVRLGSENSVLRNARIVVDEEPPLYSAINARGVYLRGQRPGITIENTEIIMKAAGGTAAIAAHSDGAGATVRNCYIQIDSGHDGIVGKEPSTFDDLPDFQIENTSIVGNQSDQKAVDMHTSRDGATIQDSCVHLTGSGSDGIRFIDSTDNVVSGTNINVSGEAIVLLGAEADTSNITQGDTCPVPDTIGGGGSGNDSTDGGSGDSSSDLPNTLTIEGDAGVLTEYRFSVSEAVARGPAGDAGDEISGTTVTGATLGGTDDFAYAGEVTSFEFLSGGATVLRNGTEVAVSDLNSGSTDGGTTDGGTTDGGTTDGGSTDGGTTEPTLSNTLTIEGDAGVLTEYTFSVSEAVARGPDGDAGDAIEATTVSGATLGGTDDFDYAGEITSFEFRSGGATVYRNGTEVDPSTLGSTALPNTVVVDGQNPSETRYRLEVDGTIERSTDGSVEADDTIEGSVASGQVVEDVDTFRFSGDLVNFKITGNAALTLDDTDG